MLVRFFLFLPNTSLRVGKELGVFIEGSDGDVSVGGWKAKEAQRRGCTGRGRLRVHGLEVQHGFPVSSAVALSGSTPPPRP